MAVPARLMIYALSISPTLSLSLSRRRDTFIEADTGKLFANAGDILPENPEASLIPVSGVLVVTVSWYGGLSPHPTFLDCLMISSNIGVLNSYPCYFGVPLIIVVV